MLRKEDPKVPEEQWDEKKDEGRRIGHAVTGVGWFKGDPDGHGLLPNTLWVIVHDTWSTTPQDVAVPWNYVRGLVRLGP
ncbi:hypothetical protein H5T56_05935 [Candidatus Bipolaricaulota bacterium]|nr:hypothetical protein [Candidatus Bipolaricaulota bacterium]